MALRKSGIFNPLFSISFNILRIYLNNYVYYFINLLKQN